MVFIAFAGVDVDLGGEVAAGVHLVVHVQGSVLRIAQVALGVGVVNAFRDFLGVVAAGVDQLAFFAVADSCAGVLTERQLAFGGDLSITQHCKSHKFVVVGGFGIMKNLSYHLVMLAAEHEGIVVGGLTGKHGECFGVNDEKLMSAPVFRLHIVGCEVVILCGVGTEGKHFLIVERFCSHGYIKRLYE